MKKITIYFSGHLNYMATEKHGDLNRLDTLKAMESAKKDLSTLHPKFNAKISELRSAFTVEEEE